jgi:hypothetical protein
MGDGRAVGLPARPRGDTTNNRAERALCVAVTWRKRSQGTVTEKGSRGGGRLLSRKETCRLQARSTYAMVADAVRCSFHGQRPDTAWLSFAKRQPHLPVIGYYHPSDYSHRVLKKRLDPRCPWRRLEGGYGSSISLTPANTFSSGQTRSAALGLRCSVGQSRYAAW